MIQVMLMLMLPMLMNPPRIEIAWSFDLSNQKFVVANVSGGGWMSSYYGGLLLVM
jgi:hypothetical protein